MLLASLFVLPVFEFDEANEDDDDVDDAFVTGRTTLLPISISTSASLLASTLTLAERICLLSSKSANFKVIPSGPPSKKLALFTSKCNTGGD